MFKLDPNEVVTVSLTRAQVELLLTGLEFLVSDRGDGVPDNEEGALIAKLTPLGTVSAELALRDKR